MYKVHPTFIPCHDVVFSMMFEDSYLFCALIKAVTGRDIELQDAPFSQISKREKATLSAVRFDLFAHTAQGTFSIDMQRTFNENLINRIIYYACRLISTQSVKEMRYSDLQPVSVSFIMSEKPSDCATAVRYITTAYKDTHEQFSDLLNIALVYVPTVIETSDKYSELRIFSEFFCITNDNDMKEFEDSYKITDLGVKLMQTYSNTLYNQKAMEAFAQEPYYTVKDAEWLAQGIFESYMKRTEENEKKTLKKLIGKVSPEDLAEAFDMPVDKIRKLLE
jgi:predicted transposase/invertase (TIGR01784 family)